MWVWKKKPINRKIKKHSDSVSFELFFPSATDILELVWKAIPDFLKKEIEKWAAQGMEQQIARAITEIVKTVLNKLPFPVPSVFIDAAANLVIPPLVALIVQKVTGAIPTGNSGEQKVTYFPLIYSSEKKRKH